MVRHPIMPYADRNPRASRFILMLAALVPMPTRAADLVRRRRKRAPAARFADIAQRAARYSAGSRIRKQAPFGVLAR